LRRAARRHPLPPDRPGFPRFEPKSFLTKRTQFYGYSQANRGQSLKHPGLPSAAESGWL
jgi:hypothetical protein